MCLPASLCPTGSCCPPRTRTPLPQHVPAEHQRAAGGRGSPPGALGGRALSAPLPGRSGEWLARPPAAPNALRAGQAATAPSSRGSRRRTPGIPANGGRLGFREDCWQRGLRLHRAAPGSRDLRSPARPSSPRAAQSPARAARTAL